MKLVSLYDPENQQIPEVNKSRVGVLSESDSVSLSGYLERGHLLIRTTATETDEIDPSSSVRLNSSILTDGDFVWEASLAHYVKAYGFSPSDELSLIHI